MARQARKIINIFGLILLIVTVGVVITRKSNRSSEKIKIPQASFAPTFEENNTQIPFPSKVPPEGL